MTALHVLRPMRREDITGVLDIDRVSFPIPWSEKTYQFEIDNRDTSHLVVIERQDGVHAPLPALQSLFQRLLGNTTPGTLVGYGGCWLIAGEAHISTIAVHSQFRGQGLGELLLAAMLQRTMTLGADYSVLEVRESNLTAQALYEKYEYVVIGRRKAYYRDNNEDALLMEVRPLNDVYRKRFDARMEVLHQRINVQDRFSHPG